MARELQLFPVATLANGHAFELAVTSSAAARGPPSASSPGTHGDEPLTVETVRRLLLELEAAAAARARCARSRARTPTHCRR